MNNTYSPAPRRNARQVFESVATFAIIAGLLYFGAGILVPLVLAVLLAFALTPLVNVLGRRLHLLDPLAVIASVLIAAFALGTFAYLVGNQVINLAADFPDYQATIVRKLSAFQEQIGGGGGFLQHLTNAIESVGEQLNGAAEEADARRPGAPIPVTISNDITSPLGMVSSLLGSVLGPLAMAAIVAVFLIFLLLGRSDLQERFIRLVSRGGYSTTNLAIADASSRVGRYLLIQLCVNIVYGIIFAIGLTIIGVPGAILWGLMIILFRYIPFVGALLIACVPFLLAFAVDPGWGMLLFTVLLFLVLDITVANAIEPRLYGSSTGVSPIAILLSAMFWATLWGPVGLILSTPMTVCLVVIGRFIPQLQVFETLLGSEPVLRPSERLYQRMLKGDTEEAIEIAEDVIDEKGRDYFFDEVLLGALQLANTELTEAPEALTQRRQVATTIEAIIEELGIPQQTGDSTVLLVGGRTEIDEAAAHLIAQHLAEQKIATRVLPPMAVRQESIGRIDLEGVTIVCLCYLGPDIKAQTRYASRRLRRLDPNLVIVACHLHSIASSETAEALRVDRLARDIEGAVEEVDRHLDIRDAAVALSDQTPFEGLGRGDDALGRALESIAEEMGVPLATINLLSDERHRDEEDAYKLTETIAQTGEPLIIHAGANEDRETDPHLQSSGVDFYAGVPLTLTNGTTVGSLVILDYEPRSFGEAELERLQQAAVDLVRRFGDPVPRPSQAGTAVPGRAEIVGLDER